MQKFQIKNRWDGTVIWEGDAETLGDATNAAVKARASLSLANLSGANLSGANLWRADLWRADLSGANLSGANLSWGSLWRADLSGANLSWGSLSGADLSGANLSGADLSGANLSGANLSGANLSGVKDADLVFARMSIVPEHGSFVGWKLCRYSVLVQLEIQELARRSNAHGRKCRAEFCKVLKVEGGEIGVSIRESDAITYRVGETVECDLWCQDRWQECGGGIHFYLTKIEAQNHTQ